MDHGSKVGKQNKMIFNNNQKLIVVNHFQSQILLTINNQHFSSLWDQKFFLNMKNLIISLNLQ